MTKQSNVKQRLDLRVGEIEAAASELFAAFDERMDRIEQKVDKLRMDFERELDERVSHSLAHRIDSHRTYLEALDWRMGVHTSEIQEVKEVAHASVWQHIKERITKARNWRGIGSQPEEVD